MRMRDSSSKMLQKAVGWEIQFKLQNAADTVPMRDPNSKTLQVPRKLDI